MAITKINTPELLDINTTGAKQLPSGTTAQRPTTGLTAGDFRYNTDDNRVEYYDGAAWFQIDDEALPVPCTTNTINYPVAVTAYYKMEDATDQTGNYNGTATSVDFNVAGKFGNAGEFNGSNSLITLPSGLNQNNNFCWSFWVNFNSLTNYDTTIALQDTYRNYLDILANGTLHFYDGVSLNSPTGTVTTSTWYNVVITKSSSTGRKMYVNGSEVASDSSTANSISGSGLNMIGAYNSGSSTSLYLDGKIDQVRIFPTALTVDNVTSLYNEVQCAPTIVPSQNFNVNTYFGTGATQAIDAKFNEAANFNGSSSVITSSSLGTALNVSSLSFSLWFKTNLNDSTDRILISSYDSTGNARFYASLLNSGLSVVIYGSSSTYIQNFINTVNTGIWYHLSVTHTGTTTTVYLNGIAITPSGTSGSAVAIRIAGSPQPLTMGQLQGNIGTYALNGKIDQVRIFDTALTGNQVTDLYNNETDATAQLLNFPVGAGCIAAYELDGNADDISGLYSGTPTDIGYTGMEFQPDFVWIKERSGSEWHNLFNSVSGSNKNLYSNEASSEATSSTKLTSFNTNGFSLGSDNNVNKASSTYVAWNWKSGGAPTTTNSAGAGNVPTAGSVKIDGVDSTTALAGTIAATSISANTDSGFSVVKYTGNGNTSQQSYGHGLSSAPELVINKGIDTLTLGTNFWIVGGTLLGNGGYMFLNATNAKNTASSYNGNQVPDSNVVYISGTSDLLGNENNKNFISYCFHSVDGYSKIGSYVGTGVAGNSIVTGFRPLFVMIKSTTTSQPWMMYDSLRSGKNYLEANSDYSEGTTSSDLVTFISNGFSVANSNSENQSGQTYIFLAIAAEPTPEPVLANSFKTVTYPGNGGTQAITGTGFEPDLVWIKERSGTDRHVLIDSVRGTNSQLSSQDANAETTYSSNLVSFDTNGFTLGSASETNGGSETYVAWCWKAGGLSAINNEGSIESIVSANPASGFSIVSYTGNAGDGSIGHGLNDTVELVLIKKTSASESWIVWYEGAGTTNFLELNDSTATQTGAGWGGVPTSSIVHLQNGGAGRSNAAANYIAYCFTSIPGYQKIGTYPGSGVSGKSVYTTDDGTSTGANGFEPSFLMIKGINLGNGYWFLLDNQRTSGTNGKYALWANEDFAESTTYDVRFDATGFTLLNTDTHLNQSYDYLYLAIA